MADEKITRCLECGGTLEPNPKTGVPTCIYCGREFKHSVDDFSIDIKSIVDLRQSREFIQAEERCAELRQKQPESSEVHWQSLLSELGVVYVTEGNEAKPTFFSYSYNERESVLENEHYKNAIKFSTSEDRAYYEKKANEIDFLLKEFFNLVAKEDSYDIFISFKKSIELTAADGEKVIADTQDYKKAEEIYNKLKDKYRVFFSPVSIGKDTGISGEKYEPRILKALQTSQAMILIGTKTEYLEAQWVQNEWRRYQYFINKGIKKKNSLILGYLNNMPRLPIALKDTQWPNFDMFSSDYIKDVYKMLEQAQVKSSKGLASSIKKRKIDTNFESEEVQFGNNSVERVKIGGNKNSIQISASEERDFQTAETMRREGSFDSAEGTYQSILKKNPNNSKAWWGLFCTQIKAKADTEVPFALSHFRGEYDFAYFHKAIETSSDTTYAFRLVDYVTATLRNNIPWKKRDQIFNAVRKYLDDNRVKDVLNILSEEIREMVVDANNLKESELIYAAACNIFFEENREFNLIFIERYASTLLKYKHYQLAQKYYEQLSGARKNALDYMNLLRCRYKTNILNNVKISFTDKPTPAEDGKRAPLTTEQIIERAIICSHENKSRSVMPDLRKMALYQIPYNKPNAKPFIELMASCIQQFGDEPSLINFYFEVAETYLQIKDFKSAETYYNEILTHDQNLSRAHWGLLKCHLRVLDDYEIGKKRKVTNHLDFSNAKNCASQADYNYYMQVAMGKSPAVFPNRAKYLAYSKGKRGLVKIAVFAGIALVAGIVIAVAIASSHPYDYVERGGYYIVTDSNSYANSIKEAEFSTHKDKNIVRIDDGAMSKRKIETLLIASTVDSIGKGAFKDCKQLTAVTIMNPGIKIEEGAFEGCTALQTVTIATSTNESVTIDANAFKGCTSLSSISQLNVASLGAGAFSGCSALTEIRLYATSANRFSTGAFSEMAEGVSIKLPSTLVALISEMQQRFPDISFDYYSNNTPGACIDLIEQITEISDETISIIEAAQQTYDALTDADKALVTNYSDLENAVRALSAYNEIKGLIDAEVITYALITSAEGTYASLSNAQKELVSNYQALVDSRLAYDLSSRISAIGTVEIDDEAEIAAIYTEINALPTDIARKIPNLSVLDEAREQLSTLIADDVVELIDQITDPSEDIYSLKIAYERYSLISESQLSLITNKQILLDYVEEYQLELNAMEYTELSDGTYGISISDLDGIEKSTIKIPSSYNGTAVTRIISVDELDYVTTVEIGANVAKISNDLFTNLPALSEITIDSANTSYASISGCIIDQELDTIIKVLENATIPNDPGVLAIGEGAFENCLWLEQITIPSNILTIKEGAFAGCENLMSVTLGSGLIQILDNAFEGCIRLVEVFNYSTLDISLGSDTHGGVAKNALEASTSSGLSRITVSGDFVLYNGVSATYVIKYTGESDSIDLSAYSYDGIASYAFYGNSTLREINLSGVSTIGASAFENCSALSSVTLSSSLTAIGDNAFYNCYKLVLVCNGSSLAITKGHTTNGYIAFYAVTVATGAGSEQFVQDTDFTVYVADNKAYIIAYTGSNTSVTVELSSVSAEEIYLSANAFAGNTSVTEITLAEGIESIGAFAFKGCTALQRVNIPTSVSSIDPSAFSGCTSLAEISVNSSNASFETQDGVLYTSGKTSVVKYPAAKAGSELLLPSTVSVIMPYAFADCTALEDVSLVGYQITCIGAHAFEGSGITSIHIPSTVSTIGDYAFASCYELSIINYGAARVAEKTANNNVFASVGKNTAGVVLNIANTVERIPSYMFCPSDDLRVSPNITAVEMQYASRLTTIGAYAFSGISTFTTIVLPQSILTIGDYAFLGCYHLYDVVNLSTNISVSSGSTANGYVGYYSTYIRTSTDSRYTIIEGDYVFFTNGSGLIYLVDYKGTERELVLPYLTGDYSGSLYSIHPFAFINRTDIVSVTMPSSTATAIGRFSFYGCTSLQSVTCSYDVASIGDCAFLASGLETIEFGGSFSSWYTSSSGTHIYQSTTTDEEYAAFLRQGTYGAENWTKQY